MSHWGSCSLPCWIGPGCGTSDYAIEASMIGSREEKIPALKLAMVQYVIVAVLAVLITGLWRLQILGATNYRELAEANRIRKVPILAPRGRLFDREGR